MLMTRIRTYSELRRIRTFVERFEYLSLPGMVGRDTFGFDRYLNQTFYRSNEWRQIRNSIIIRDNGCDLGIAGYEIHDRLYIHHMNPINASEIIYGDSTLLDPEFLITTTHSTHNAIHYGNANSLTSLLVERKPGDTKLW